MRGVKVPLAAAALSALISSGCGGARPVPTTHPPLASATRDVRVAAGRPPVAVVARDGDPEGALAAAVSTEGIEPSRGAEVAVALGALVEGRLAAQGVRAANVVPGWDGYRVRLLLARGDAGNAAPVVETVRTALSARATDGELALVQRRLDALSRRPIPDDALEDAVQCTGEAFAMPGRPLTTEHLVLATLEAWRMAAYVDGRVALAAVGSPALVEAVADAVAAGPAWGSAAASGGAAPSIRSRPDARAEVYQAADLAPGTARVTLAVHTARASQAVAAAETLGDPRGALASRLRALEAPAKLHDVTATAHATEGCVALTLLFAAKDLGSDAPSRIATAAALARQEAEVEVLEAPADPDLGRFVAARAGDPRDAAERAAWWTLVARSGSTQAARSPGVSIAIGLATGRDGPDADVASAIREELDRATVAWHEPVVEARSRVERGQGELWILVGSPCGTLAEAAGDAGLGALVALATGARASHGPRANDVMSEGWATADGLGVIVHGPPGPGESPLALARRIADAAARSFAADPLDAEAIAEARGFLFARASVSDETRAFAGLALALAPGHPSWVLPFGTAESLGRSSDASVRTRASALRAGPLRVAVLANVDSAEADAAVRAVDRWVARRPGEVRACPAPTTEAEARPGTYAVEIPGAISSEAWLAIPLTPGDDAARASATVLAAALDGPDGLLAGALGAGMARAWSARVLGPSRASALVVRVSSVQGALDGSVAEVRALLDRVRQGSLTDADRTRALSSLASLDLEASLDPRERLIALWRGDRAAPAGDAAPSLTALRSFAAAMLRDDALVLVAARPPRDLRLATPAKAP